MRAIQGQTLLDVTKIRRDGYKRNAQKPAWAGSGNFKRIELPRLRLRQEGPERPAEGRGSEASQYDDPHFAGKIKEVPLRFLDLSAEAVAIAISHDSPSGQEGLRFDDQPVRQDGVVSDKNPSRGFMFRHSSPSELQT